MAEEPRFLIVGLGNPGEEYKATRHNVGFLVIDELASRYRIDIRRQDSLALTARAELGRTMVLLMKPLTYMNASGRAAAATLPGLGLEPADLIAIYDDLDLPLGRVRVRPSGGAGGHRGVTSLVDELGNDGFVRIRVGVGRPPAGEDVVRHVLSPFLPDEHAAAADAVRRAADAVEAVVTDGVERAMQAFNAA